MENKIENNLKKDNYDVNKVEDEKRYKKSGKTLLFVLCGIVLFLIISIVITLTHYKIEYVNEISECYTDMVIADENNNEITRSSEFEKVSKIYLEYNWLGVKIKKYGVEISKADEFDDVPVVNIKINDKRIRGKSKSINNRLQIYMASEKEVNYIIEELSNVLNKTIYVGMYPDFIPMEYYDENNDLVGFDVDLLNNLSKDIGFNYEIKIVDFTSGPNGMMTAIKNGDIDIIISGIEDTIERRVFCDFTDVYYTDEFIYLGEQEKIDYRIAVRKSFPLLNHLNEKIRLYKDDGTINEIEEKWKQFLD